jgi:hypothetical protein
MTTMKPNSPSNVIHCRIHALVRSKPVRMTIHDSRGAYQPSGGAHKLLAPPLSLCKPHRLRNIIYHRTCALARSRRARTTTRPSRGVHPPLGVTTRPPGRSFRRIGRADRTALNDSYSRPSTGCTSPLSLPWHRTLSGAPCPARRRCSGPFPRDQPPPVRVPAPLSLLLPSRPRLSQLYHPCCFHDTGYGPGNLALLAAAAQDLFHGPDRLPHDFLRRAASRSLSGPLILPCLLSPYLFPSRHRRVRIKDRCTLRGPYRGPSHAVRCPSVSRTTAYHMHPPGEKLPRGVIRPRDRRKGTCGPHPFLFN